MKPAVRFLSDKLIERILTEARDVLGSVGLEIHNDTVVSMFADHGAEVVPSTKRVRLNNALIDRALATTPAGFKLFDVHGEETHDFSSGRTYFTPGSAAINILDPDTGEMRRPTTTDYVRYAMLVDGLEHIAAQATAFIAADVPEHVSDSYRLYLSLLYGRKPVVTGGFTIESFEVMKEMQLAVRGTEEALAGKPLTLFSCCPTAPLKWSEVTSQNVLDCARYAIPVEFISMPLPGFMAPVTLVGSLVQHTAETLSGIVISQLASPGAPILYGGSPAIFDVRYETTPMGAIETQMIECAYCEIGRHLGLPTQAYIGLSDAKELDAQAGLETGIGATLAALSGINNISGPGMLDFESCQSLEKLVVDNEICGMAERLMQGIEPREDFPSAPRFEEMIAEGHLLISDHTRRHLRAEHYFPGPVIDRANRSRWHEEGRLTLGQRAQREVARRLAAYEPTGLPETTRTALTELMTRAASGFGMDELPSQDV